MKKGFVFIETIIVITVLLACLFLIYNSFNTILNNEKRRASYNDVNYIYRTYYLEDFIASLNIRDYINNHMEENQVIIGFNCSDRSLYNNTNNQIDGSGQLVDDQEKYKMDFCESLLSQFKAVNVYITEYNINRLKECSVVDNAECRNMKNNLRNLSNGALRYLKTLSGTDDGYRLIVEYEEPMENGKTKNYFSNVKLIVPGLN